MRTVGVLVGLPIYFAPLIGIKKVIVVDELLKGERRIEVHLGLAFLGVLGRNDDDTIGSLRTVDGSRGRILQYLYTFHIVARKDGTDTITCHHTVDDIQRR